MKINQLFKSTIPEDLLGKILLCYGITLPNVTPSFSKIELDRLKTVEKMCELREELTNYYLPCKARLYLNNINERKCVTVLRQILRLYGFVLISDQKYIKQKKCTVYHIQKQSSEENILHNIKIDNEPTIIRFS